jgi:hypothetical protein
MLEEFPSIDSIMENELLALPPRARGRYSEHFAKKEIITNHYKVVLANIQRIVVFSMKI